MSKDQEHKRYPHKKDYQPEVTAADLTEKVNHHLTTLIEAIKTGNTERLTSYLAFASRFHTYSRRNQELIAEEQDADTEQDEKTRKAKEVFFVTRNFRVGSVFDVSQLTLDRRPPEFFTAIAG